MTHLFGGGHLPLAGTSIRADTGDRHRRKYESWNPLQRTTLARFHRRVYGRIAALGPRRVLDFGCGEGYFWAALASHGPLPEVVGIDLRRDAIEAARSRFPAGTFLAVDLFDFHPEGPPFDLVVASQVLEHLDDPAAYLERLCALSAGPVLLTVPHEPFFRLCNLIRGRDIARLGNHPEHLQRWSRGRFGHFASQYLDVISFETSFPFLVLLGRARRAGRDPGLSSGPRLGPGEAAGPGPGLGAP